MTSFPFSALAGKKGSSGKCVLGVEKKRTRRFGLKLHYDFNLESEHVRPDVVPCVGIRGYHLTGCEKVDPVPVVVNIEATSQVLRCPRCGSLDVIRKGSVRRLFHGTPVGGTQMYFEAAIPRVHCDGCGITRQVRIAFAEEKRRHTRQFERYAQELVRG